MNDFRILHVELLINECHPNYFPALASVELDECVGLYQILPEYILVIYVEGVGVNVYSKKLMPSMALRKVGV